MINSQYSIFDRTQIEIAKHLEATSQLLQLASGGYEPTITIMPDCCPSHNSGRNLDGFYTGTVIKLPKTNNLVIPVWSTINYCGVCIYKLRHCISTHEFKTRVEETMNSSHDRFSWNNYDRGNHFVSLMYSDGTGVLEEGQYLVVHASANEYRPKLYPNNGVWYEPHIKTVSLPNSPERSLHYIEGGVAEKFYSLVEELKTFNKERNKTFCEYVLSGGLADEEILCIDHYGMPDPYTICIGTQWELNGLVPLLTAPGEDIYLVETRPETKYFPHGFGLKLAEGSSIKYSISSDGANIISIGNKDFTYGDSIKIGIDAINRVENSNVYECVETIKKVLPFKIVATLSQTASFSSIGFKIW